MEDEKDTHEVRVNAIRWRPNITLYHRVLRMLVEARRQAGSGEPMVSSCDGRDARGGSATTDAARDPKKMDRLRTLSSKTWIAPSTTSHEGVAHGLLVRARGVEEDGAAETGRDRRFALFWRAGRDPWCDIEN
jgi:hypothetical protein